MVPDDGYMTKVKALCEKYNILLIADEVQTGLGRTGYNLAVDHDKCKPDIVILGKVRGIKNYDVNFFTSFICDLTYLTKSITSIIRSYRPFPVESCQYLL